MTWKEAAVWVRTWWSVIVGLWLITVSVVLLIVALETLATQTSQEKLAADAKAQAESIQRERSASLVSGCVDQNERNRRAHRRALAYPAVVRRFADGLIDELQPFRGDCEAYAAERVKAR